jgi:hypothetical protein
MKRENEISKLFRTAGLNEPSEQFSQKVMDQVNLERQLLSVKTFKPIIKLNIFIGLAMLLALLILIIFVFRDSFDGAGKYNVISSHLSNLLINNYHIWSIIPLILSSSFLLLLIDNFFNRKKHKNLLLK